MPGAPNRHGVVEWPIDTGKTTAPIHWTMAGSPEESGLVVWVGGFGVELPDLAVAAQRLSRYSGLAVAGIKMPIKDVACKSNSMATGLDHLIQNSVHLTAEQIAPGLVPFLGGDSRGGNVVLEAGTHGPSRGIVTLFPMGLTNTALGRHPLTRGVEIGRRLVRTAKNHGLAEFWSDPANRRVVAGGLDEVMGLTLCGRMVGALGYGFGDGRQESVLNKIAGYKQRVKEDRNEGGFRVGLHFVEADDCFVLADNLAAMRSIGCMGLAIVIKGRHTCVGGEAARKQLEAVGRWLGRVNLRQLALAA